MPMEAREGAGMEHRRLGRLGRENGVLIFGGAAVGEAAEGAADTAAPPPPPPSRRSLERSLERLRVDHVDLLQLHAVCDPEDLDRATGPGGALEAAIQAKEEGLVGT